MTDPAITGALEALIASTPPATVWGVRYTQTCLGTDAGYIAWCDSEAEAESWLAEEQAAGCVAELVRITGRVRPADATESGGAR